MLRLAQFKLSAAGGKNEEAATVAEGLLRGLSALQEGEELKKMSELMVLGTVLGTMGVADYLDDWLSLSTTIQGNTWLGRDRSTYPIPKDRKGTAGRRVWCAVLDWRVPPLDSRSP